MLIKRRPPQFTGSAESKYRHENVIIMNFYVASHILYDRHLYECILWGFCTYLKEAWGCTPPPRGKHCHFSTIMCLNSRNVAAGKGYDHVSAGLEYPSGVQLEMDRDREGLSRGYDLTSLQTVLCHIAGMLALFCSKKKMFPTIWWICRTCGWKTSSI